MHLSPASGLPHNRGRIARGGRVLLASPLPLHYSNGAAMARAPIRLLQESAMTTTSVPLSALPSITLVLGQAVQNAYAAFDGRSTAPIAGWTLQGQITGWDGIFVIGGAEEQFALIYQNASDAGQFLIAFRGTASKDDVFKDIEAPTTAFIAADGSKPDVDVHEGFFGIYHDIGGSMTASMQAQLFQWIDANATGISQLYITGHSLGSSLAELFTFDLALTQPAFAFATIDWAAPRVGTRKWIAAYDGNALTAQTIRIVNSHDVVPDLPPATFLYEYGQVANEALVAFENQTTVIDPLTLVLIRHSMDNYLTVLTHALTGSAPLWPFDFADAISNGVTDRADLPQEQHAVGRATLIAKVRAQHGGRLR